MRRSAQGAYRAPAFCLTPGKRRGAVFLFFFSPPVLFISPGCGAATPARDESRRLEIRAGRRHAASRPRWDILNGANEVLRTIVSRAARPSVVLQLRACGSRIPNERRTIADAKGEGRATRAVSHEPVCKTGETRRRMADAMSRSAGLAEHGRQVPRQQPNK